MLTTTLARAMLGLTLGTNSTLLSLTHGLHRR